MDLAKVKIFNVRYEGYADGSVKFMSDAIKDLTGYSKEEFNDKTVTWTNIMHKDDQKSARDAFVAGLKGNKTYEREYRVISKSGEIKWIMELSQIICHPDGSIKFVMGILLDTTYQRMAEEEEARRLRLGGKYLSFRLGREEFGVKIDAIKEINTMLEITPIPDAPPFVRGVVNLRGRVVPVVDLSLKLGLEDMAYNDRTCIIIAEVNGNLGPIGVLADSVSEIIQINGEDIDDVVQHRLNTDYIFGMARTAKGVKVLLDLSRMLRPEDLILGDQASPELPGASKK
jgi:purine-binding chemotaxis protein CheW